MLRERIVFQDQEQFWGVFFKCEWSWLCCQNKKQFWLEFHSCIKTIKGNRVNNEKKQQKQRMLLNISVKYRAA